MIGNLIMAPSVRTNGGGLKEGLSYVPFVGTGMDVNDFYHDPNVENALWVVLGLASDVFGLKGLRSLRQAGKAVKQSKGLIRTSRGYSLPSTPMPYWRERQIEQQRRLILNRAKKSFAIDSFGNTIDNRREPSYPLSNYINDLVNWFK